VHRPELLRSGTLDIVLPGLVGNAIVLGIAYGLCMCVFSLTAAGSQAPMQILASAIKVPALFFLTLLVTFPSLYVFSALVGSRLGLTAVLKLMVASVAIIMTVLASLGPIVAFFALTTSSYAFMQLLNVAVFSLSGFLGGGFLLRTLRRLTHAIELEASAAVQVASVSPPLPPPPPPPAPAVQALGHMAPAAAATIATAGVSAIAQSEPVNVSLATPPPPPPAPAVRPHLPVRTGTNVQFLYTIWVGVFGLVGAQMAWILRPFIGDPHLPFQWFRPTGSNFFEAVYHAIEKLF
jgi:hypothetical protein